MTMSWEVFIVVLLAALGTWALRYVPILLSRGQPGKTWSRFLSATGPAAIAALTVASFLPELSLDLAQLIPVLVGTAAVVLGFLWRRDIAIATIGGAIAYGIAFALIAM